MPKPRILYLPTRSHTDLVFQPETFKLLLESFEVKVNDRGEDYTTEQVAREIEHYDGLVTGWGTPPLDGSVFERAKKLRIIAHSAGSVKYMLSKDVVRRYVVPMGICVFSANEAIAYNVAESTIGYMIMASRRFMEHALAVRHKKAWRDPSIPWNGQFLSGSSVGVVGASKVGRHVIRLLKPFDVKIFVYDPYLPELEAEKLGVTKAGLDEVFSRCDILTIHAPSTEETFHMVGERQLALMKDGALLVNTSRGSVIDHQALLAKCREGRIRVVLDVTDPEPLPPDSPLRLLENVIITPHISGAGYYGYHKIGSSTLQALLDFFAGRKVEGEVSFQNYDVLA
ncbi:MAG: hydroxyacid dehydrogenase [Candidatus Brockarchaeota archaeon]|nr:hydroxyacid dehydrogenase [Candidatus Brockarchaeota archaeon]